MSLYHLVILKGISFVIIMKKTHLEGFEDLAPIKNF